MVKEKNKIEQLNDYLIMFIVDEGLYPKFIEYYLRSKEEANKRVIK